MTGTFELKEQRGNKGYYGKVLIEVEPDNSIKGPEISFDERNAKNKEWREAARFGIQYAYTHIARRDFTASGHRIRVQRIQGHPFDTNSLIVAYVAACALFRAFGKRESELVTFDPESGRIAFSR
jgi:hypothetical protein